MATPRSNRWWSASDCRLGQLPADGAVGERRGMDVDVVALWPLADRRRAARPESAHRSSAPPGHLASARRAGRRLRRSFRRGRDGCVRRWARRCWRRDGYADLPPAAQQHRGDAATVRVARTASAGRRVDLAPAVEVGGQHRHRGRPSWGPVRTPVPVRNWGCLHPQARGRRRRAPSRTPAGRFVWTRALAASCFVS